MKLSMWMLYDWLEPFAPRADIEVGRPTLRNARHFSSDVQIERQNVYLGRESEFFPTGGNGIILVNGNDLIRLASDDYEAVFNSVLKAFDYYNAWADSLTDMISQGCAIQALADRSADVFADPFFIQNAMYRIIAYSKRYGPGSLDKDWDDIVLTQSMRIDRIAGINNLIKPMMGRREPFVFPKGFFQYGSICTNLFLHNKHMGWFILLSDKQASSIGRMHLCEAFVNLIVQWMTKNDEDNKRQAHNDLFIDLVDGKDVHRDMLHRTISILDWRPDDQFLVIKINCINEHSQELPLLVEPIERNLHGCVAIAIGFSLMVVANLRLNDSRSVIHELTSWMKQSDAYCGISNPFTDIQQLRPAYEQAQIAASCGDKTAGQANWLEDYAIDYTLNRLKKEHQGTILHRSLETLRSYDRMHETKLFETLDTYIREERSMARTADRLFLHRNSLYYRINRIIELTALDLDDPQTRLHLLLSFSLEKTTS